MNSDELEFINNTLTICLYNNEVMVKERLEYLLQNIPQESWTKFNCDGQQLADKC